jgi:hypothetical protein
MPWSPMAWRHAVAIGAIGGITLVAMELLLLPVGMSGSEILELAIRIVPQWIVTGIAIACLAHVVERGLTAPQMAGALIVFALAMSGTFALVRHLARQFDVLAGSSSLGFNAPSLPTYLYDLWVILFFGGLFMTARILSIRSDRTRESLGRAGIERRRTVALLERAQLQALQGNVDPAFLLRVISELERRHPANAPSGDRLLDQLVDFLRHAMPGVRSGRSTLEAEVALARIYGQLWADLDPRHPRFVVRSDRPVPRLPFPPLLLLPMIDQWLAATAPESHREIVVTCRADAVTLTLASGTAVPGWLPTQLAYRLQVGLRTTFGENWSVLLPERTAAGNPGHSLTLTLPVAPSAAPATTQETTDELR